jgi:Rrf2 family protein
MAVIAREPETVHATHGVATALGVSEAHLAKVMQRLTRAGLVNSVRGPKGGFVPAKSASDVTLIEIYEAIEGPFEPKGCLLKKPACNGTDCILGQLLANVNREMHDYLANTTLSKVCQKLEEPHEANAENR